MCAFVCELFDVHVLVFFALIRAFVVPIGIQVACFH